MKDWLPTPAPWLIAALALLAVWWRGRWSGRAAEVAGHEDRARTARRGAVKEAAKAGDDQTVQDALQRKADALRRGK